MVPANSMVGGGVGRRDTIGIHDDVRS
jgi:hypothetical protein